MQLCEWFVANALLVFGKKIVPRPGEGVFYWGVFSGVGFCCSQVWAKDISQFQQKLFNGQGYEGYLFLVQSYHQHWEYFNQKSILHCSLSTDDDGWFHGLEKMFGNVWNFFKVFLKEILLQCPKQCFKWALALHKGGGEARPPHCPFWLRGVSGTHSPEPNSSSNASCFAFHAVEEKNFGTLLANFSKKKKSAKNAILGSTSTPWGRRVPTHSFTSLILKESHKGRRRDTTKMFPGCFFDHDSLFSVAGPSAPVILHETKVPAVQGLPLAKMNELIWLKKRLPPGRRTGPHHNGRLLCHCSWNNFPVEQWLPKVYTYKHYCPTKIPIFRDLLWCVLILHIYCDLFTCTPPGKPSSLAPGEVSSSPCLILIGVPLSLLTGALTFF